MTDSVRLERALRKAKDQLQQEVRDRTAELTQATTALSEREAYYRGLFENASDIIATITPEGIITSANRIAEKVLGWSLNEIIGQHFRKVCVPVYVQPIEDRVRRFLAGEKLPSTFELECWRKDGGRVPFEMRNRPMYTQDGKLREFQVIFRDITERKKVEEQLHQAKEAAEAADQAKSEMLALMNHEMRTPLGVIMGYIELLQEGEGGQLSPDQEDMVHRVGANARGLLDLINNVLDLSRLNTGRLPIDYTRFSLASLFEEIEAETRDSRELSGLDFNWHIAADVPLILSDAGKLKIVVKNLVQNAIKFTQTGSVTIQAQCKADEIEISVTDTGVGIGPEQQAVIFDVFRQGSSHNVRGQRGVGLGLHIVQRLLDALRGTIAVESAVGQGARFCIRLPLQSVQAQAEL